jgi:hypothetical protein
MMSDVMLIAILGIIGTLLGAVAGAAITGYISYRNTKLQITARSAELKEQLEHHQREARRSLRAEDRKRYLVPLRETATKWVVELTRMIEQTDSIGRTIKRPKLYPFMGSGKKESVEPQKQTLEVIQRRMEASKKKLEDLLGQVNDEELILSIDEVLLKESDVRHNSFPILNYQIGMWLGTPKEDIAESLNNALRENRKASIELRRQLQKVNKRIEELLLGDETT